MTGRTHGADPEGTSIRMPTIWSIAVPWDEANAVAMNERNNGRPARRCGAMGSGDDSVRWRVWAPKAERVSLVLIDGGARREIPMQKEEGGYHRHVEVGVPQGRRYAYRLGDGPDRPDPCSLWQPEGVHGPSAVLLPERFSWCDRDWRGVRREDLVFYELHVGTFTPEGTFEAIIPRLGELRDLGVTAVEIMPVGPVSGRSELGLRRRATLRGAGQLRRAAGPPSTRGRLPRRRARDLPGRRL